MTREAFLKSISELKSISPVFSQLTKMPMVFCDEETMDDYIYVYADAEEALEHAKKLTQEKSPAVVVNCKDKEVLQFFAELRLTGVNAICFMTPAEQGGEKFMVQLDEFLRVPDYTGVPEAQRPLENPTLHLSMLYFMQEIRKPVPMEEKKNLAQLEEETSVNLARARFMVPLREQKTDDGANQKSMVLLKNDKEESYVPLFTDNAEIRKFMQGKPCPALVTDFAGVVKLLANEGLTGIAVNPVSSNVMLQKAGIESIKNRFMA